MLMLPVNALVKGLNQVSMNDPLLEGWMGVSPAELARYTTCFGSFFWGLFLVILQARNNGTPVAAGRVPILCGCTQRRSQRSLSGSSAKQGSACKTD